MSWLRLNGTIKPTYSEVTCLIRQLFLCPKGVLLIQVWLNFISMFLLWFQFPHSTRQASHIKLVVILIQLKSCHIIQNMMVNICIFTVNITYLQLCTLNIPWFWFMDGVRALANALPNNTSCCIEYTSPGRVSLVVISTDCICTYRSRPRWLLGLWNIYHTCQPYRFTR